MYTVQVYTVYCTLYILHCTLYRQPGENEDREEALAGGGIDLLVVPGLAFTRQKKKDIDIDFLVVPGLEFTRQNNTFTLKPKRKEGKTSTSTLT